MSDQKKCAHPACNCEVADEDKYCSQYCKDAGDTLELSCNCRHAGCILEVAAGAVPSEAA